MLASGYEHFFSALIATYVLITTQHRSLRIFANYTLTDKKTMVTQLCLDLDCARNAHAGWVMLSFYKLLPGTKLCLADPFVCIYIRILSYTTFLQKPKEKLRTAKQLPDSTGRSAMLADQQCWQMDNEQCCKATMQARDQLRPEDYSLPSFLVRQCQALELGPAADPFLQDLKGCLIAVAFILS